MSEQLIPTQIAMLLPTHQNIDELVERCRASDDGWDPRRIWRIRKLMENIVDYPYLPGYWIDLATAFEMHDELQWKYFHIAHRLRPDSSIGLLECIASSCNNLGDFKQAMDLIDEAIARAPTDEERASAIEHKQFMQFNERVRYATPVCVSRMDH